jgi:hypothetical protein
MVNSKTKRSQDLLLGPLPTEMVNRTLEMELEPGDVVISGTAQRHVQRKHPDDYAAFLPHIAEIIANPRYLGDDFKNDGIEFWGYVAVHGTLVLVAVEVVPDEDGCYNVLSFYRVSEGKAQKRRDRKFLHVPKKPGA